DEGAPLYDPLSALLSTAGVGSLLYLAVVRRSRWSVVWLAAAVLGVLIAAFSLGYEGAAGYRLLMQAPALAVGGAVTVVGTGRAIGAIIPRSAPIAGALGLAA